MESRRFKDIIAFKFGDHTPVAFHSRNMELAEVSEELWNSLIPTNTPDETQSTLIHDLNLWNDEENSSAKMQSLTPQIRSLTINLAQICNLACNYCAAGGDGTYGSKTKKLDIEKALPQLGLLLQRLNNGDSFNITFLGGEPLLYPDAIREIYHFVNLTNAGRNIQMNYSVVTNGTLIDEKIAQLLGQISAQITISLDGPAEINDRVRPRKDGQSTTEAILSGLNHLTSVRPQLSALNVHGVFDANNMNLTEAYKFYSILNFDRYVFTFSVEETSSTASKEFVEQMSQVAAMAFAKGGESELRKIECFDRTFRALDEQIKIENYCGYRKKIAIMDTQAKIYTCPWLVGDKDEEIDLASLDKNQDLNSDSMIKQNNCESCWARHFCGGGCLYIHKKATGNLHKKSISFCERTQSLIALTFIYYKTTRTGATA